MQRRADPYMMNQDHVSQQPSADKYLTGDSSSFAEDVTTPSTWEKEYANGYTKRNEIGMPEMRPETYTHAEKTAGLDHETLLKKSNLCITVARRMLKGRKFSSTEALETAVEDQAVALMHMPNADLVQTAARLVNDEEQTPAQQTQQAQAQAPAQQTQQAGMSQQAVEQMVQALVQQALAAQGQRGKLANDSQQGQQQTQQANQGQGQQQTQQANQGQGQQQTQQANQGQQGQQQTQQANKGQGQWGQQQMQQANQGQGQQQTQQANQGQGQQQTQQAMETMQSDDMLLDEMLMGPDGGDMGVPMAEMDVELEAPSMDVGEIPLAHEDEVLKTLFANDESEQAEQAQAPAEQHQKTAGMVRTASARTLGTRPSGGVSKVGGAPSGRSGGDVDKLAALWPSAPDVRDAFNMK
jgi:hypothetical protein